MPEPSKPGQDDLDPDLEAEVGEFEAVLKKQVEEARIEPMVDDPRLDLPTGSFPTKEEIEARLSKAVDDAESYLGPVRHDEWMHEQEELRLADQPEEGVHGEFSNRLKDIDSRYGKLKGGQESEKAKKRKIIQSDAESARGLGVGISVAYTIIGLPLFGAFVGWFLDNSFGTKTWQGICVLIGGVLGVVMGLFIMNRANRNS